MQQQSPKKTQPRGITQADVAAYQLDTPPHGTARPKRRTASRPIVTALMVFGIIACVLTANISLSAGGGALAGQRDRNVQATQTTVADIALQYELAQSDLAQARYGIAAQRLRWILDRDANYAGAAEQLTQAEQQITGSAFQATVPPPDSTEPDQLFAEAQAFADEQEWASVLARIEQLEVIAPTYQPEAVLDLKFRALEALGLIYVRGDRIEEGLFLLDQASAIKPLSDEAEGERNIAELYSDAEIYIDLDWAVVVEKYQQIFNLAPAYRDFPFELQTARSEYGQQLESDGEFCAAAEQYELALSLYAEPNPIIEDRLEDAEASCTGGASIARTSTPSGTAAATSTATDDEDDSLSPSDLDDDEDEGTRTPTATINPLVPTPVLPGN